MFTNSLVQMSDSTYSVILYDCLLCCKKTLTVDKSMFLY